LRAPYLYPDRAYSAQERFSYDLARSARAEEFREGHEQMDRQEEQIAHELETILPANLHTRLHHSGDSCQICQFATHSRSLATLRDSGNYIPKLPSARLSPHSAPITESRAQGPGMAGRQEALMLVATQGGPTMFARIGIMRALNRQGR
jgi:hypothetical protein